jgi:hypothetical protein
MMFFDRLLLCCFGVRVSFVGNEDHLVDTAVQAAPVWL